MNLFEVLHIHLNTIENCHLGSKSQAKKCSESNYDKDFSDFLRIFEVNGFPALQTK